MKFLEIALLDRGQPLFAQAKINFRLTTFQKLSFVWVENDVTINDSLHNLLLVLSPKVLIAQTRLNVFLGDIDKVLSINTTLQQL